jgi:hypothetical protein
MKFRARSICKRRLREALFERTSFTARITQWLISKRSLHMEPCRTGRGLRTEFFSCVNDAHKTASTGDYIVQLEGCRREVSFSSRLLRRSKISWRTSPRSFPLTLILLSLAISTFITIPSSKDKFVSLLPHWHHAPGSARKIAMKEARKDQTGSSRRPERADVREPAALFHGHIARGDQN